MTSLRSQISLVNLLEHARSLDSTLSTKSELPISEDVLEEPVVYGALLLIVL